MSVQLTEQMNTLILKHLDACIYILMKAQSAFNVVRTINFNSGHVENVDLC